MQLADAERTRLLVDGVQTAITADVTRRRDDGMVVTQPLPFLRLDTPVTADGGRRARISRVCIAMDGDVPRLLLELLDEPPSAAELPEVDPEADGDDTLVGFTPGVSTRPARTDSTVPYEVLTEERRRAEVVLTDEITLPEDILAQARPPEPAPSWLARLVAKLGSWLSALWRRPTPALPPPS